jgi:Mlc titration factor MtfA (ptsG expression regulator)
MLHFLNDVTITGVEIIVDDKDKVLVAVSTVILLFGFPDWRYRNLNEVLLYEGSFSDTYQTKNGKRNILGMVGTGAMSKTMILSKSTLHQGFKNKRSKSNVCIHEFVHLLDMPDGTTDGLPKMLIKRQFVIPWLHEMHKEIKQIEKSKSSINPYGATNEAEFFSVAGEYFFNQPEQFSKDHPELSNA